MAAAASGALFGVARWMPFVAAAAGGMLLVLAMPPLWRGVPGRATGPTVDLGGGGAAEVVALGAAPSAPAP
jgi:hypothetical protein